MHMQLSVRQIKYLRSAASGKKVNSTDAIRSQYPISQLLKVSREKKR